MRGRLLGIHSSAANLIKKFGNCRNYRIVFVGEHTVLSFKNACPFQFFFACAPPKATHNFDVAH